LTSERGPTGHERLTLVLGGARSGKSDYALKLAMAAPPPWVFVATAEPLDAEMQDRIKRHKEARGEGWITLEAPIDLASALEQAPVDAPVVIDCFTLWLSNLMLGGHSIEHEVGRLDAALDDRNAATIAVSNEVGLGVIPETPLGRTFRDEAGALNRHLAVQAGRVIMMVAGLPLTIKPVRA
jgi:adenosylcobinamide kinase / adenosylcobinamide-phosphate guanylyltransferase